MVTAGTAQPPASANARSVLATGLGLLLLASRASAIGFLSAGCQDNWQLIDGGAVLGTYCNDHVCNEVAQIQINLDTCIANIDGVLTPMLNGNFSKSCADCVPANGRYSLNCVCADSTAAGTLRPTELNLNSGFITNWYGYLSCFGQTDYPDYVLAYYCLSAGWQPSAAANDTTCWNATGCAQPCDDNVLCRVVDVADWVNVTTHSSAATNLNATATAASVAGHGAVGAVKNGAAASVSNGK